MLMIRSGINVNAEAGDFGTAVQIAQVRGDKRIIGILEQNGVDYEIGSERLTASLLRFRGKFEDSLV